MHESTEWPTATTLSFAGDTLMGKIGVGTHCVATTNVTIIVRAIITPLFYKKGHGHLQQTVRGMCVFIGGDPTGPTHAQP